MCINGSIRYPEKVFSELMVVCFEVYLILIQTISPTCSWIMAKFDVWSLPVVEAA